MAAPASRKKGKPNSDKQPPLFPLPARTPQTVEPLVKRLRRPVWTESKAKLIERYLKLFVLVTHHGAYIDAFAGPQEDEKPEMWTAKLVMDSEPRWFRKLFFCEDDKEKVAKLRTLIATQRPRGMKEPKRTARVLPGDCNVEIPKLLRQGVIAHSEATFCLLDQRTFECHWDTVVALANYKPAPKIELFYFLPQKWLARSMAGLTKNPDTATKWWGRSDWASLQQMRPMERDAAFVERFKELGYASVKAWPIHERRAGGGAVMYSMIHATDHPDAPALMRRAFEAAVDPTKPGIQYKLDVT